MTNDVVRVSATDGSIELGGERLLTATMVARLLGITVRGWRTMTYRGYAPKPDAGKRWRASTIEAFRESRPGRGRAWKVKPGEVGG